MYGHGGFMTSVQLFLIAWHLLTLRSCFAGTLGAAGIDAHVLYYGWCDQAVLVAHSLGPGGFWAYSTQ